MGQVKIICAWHPKNFNSELVMRVEEWVDCEDGESHGCCPACLAKENAKRKGNKSK